MRNGLREQILRIAQGLEAVAKEVRHLAELIEESGKTVDAGDFEVMPEKTTKDRVEELIASLRRLGRDEAKRRLEQLKHEELGEIFAAFGASRDRKRRKSWLIEQILWYLFDFEAGHRLLRDG